MRRPLSANFTSECKLVHRLIGIAVWSRFVRESSWSSVWKCFGGLETDLRSGPCEAQTGYWLLSDGSSAESDICPYRTKSKPPKRLHTAKGVFERREEKLSSVV